MKKLCTLSLTLAVALISGAPAAGAPSLPGSPPLTAPLGAAVEFSVLGGSEGKWDLPSGASDGFASGVLTLGEGFPFFLMSVTLPASGVAQVGSSLTGTLSGGLLSFPLPPTGVFDMDVSGTWTVNPLTGKGTFTAFFSRQLSPSGPTILLGGMRGRFEDLESPFGPDRLGFYAARWGLLN